MGYWQPHEVVMSAAEDGAVLKIKRDPDWGLLNFFQLKLLDLLTG